MKQKIRGCEDKRLQASTHQPEDRRIQGCEYTSKQVCEDTNKHTEYMSLRIRGCEDTML